MNMNIFCLYILILYCIWLLDPALYGGTHLLCLKFKNTKLFNTDYLKACTKHSNLKKTLWKLAKISVWFMFSYFIFNMFLFGNTIFTITQWYYKKIRTIQITATENFIFIFLQETYATENRTIVSKSGTNSWLSQ